MRDAMLMVIIESGKEEANLADLAIHQFRCSRQRATMVTYWVMLSDGQMGVQDIYLTPS